MQALSYYIQHPNELDAEAVNELELLLTRNPYFEVARLLYVRGLYTLQDDRFGQELRTAALYVRDRSRLFDLIEAHNYQLKSAQQHRIAQPAESRSTDRTVALIDSFLSIQPEQPRQHKPMTADAHTDYMAFLMQQEEAEAQGETDAPAEGTNQDRIIDQFIDNNHGRMTLPYEPSNEDEQRGTTYLDDESDTDDETADNSIEEPTNKAFFTETLAQIYIKQGKYVKAKEIIRRLSLSHPQKNRYFADQLRFLDKLIVNQQAK